MKKKTVAALLCMILALSGCGGGTGAEPAKPEVTETDAAAPADTAAEPAAPADTSAAVTEAPKTDYFEITVPSEIADLVKIDTSADRIDIYDKESYDAGFGGHVVTVWAVQVPKEFAGGPYRKIGELSKGNADVFDVVRGYATEIQWDYNLPDAPDSFKKIDAAAEGIVASVTGINGYTYTAGAGMKGEDLYREVLAKYVKGVNERWDADRWESLGMSPEFCMAADDGGLDAIEYACGDCNDDGIDELFVGPKGEGDWKGVIYDVYTMVDRSPKLVVSGSARNRYYANHYFIHNEWSGGAAESGCDEYALMSNDTEMVYQYGYKYDGYENEDAPWFKSYDGEEFEAVTEDEYNSGIENIKTMSPGFDFSPLSKNTDAVALADTIDVAAAGAALPAYEYPGPELFYSVLYQYLCDELSKGYDKGDVGIPCPIIIAEDESDKNDIKVWGNFWYYNYKLNGDTLETMNGGSYPGCIHIKSTDAGYEVTSMDVVGDGSDYDPTAKKIFGDHYDAFVKSNADEKGNEQIRAQIIANYAAANNLSVTQYKDYGWDPVKLPEENIDNFYSVLD